MSNAKEIGERVKKARLNSGYATIEQFIKIHKIPRTTYTQYEAGTRSISIKRILEICTMFNTNLIWIITGKGDPAISNADLIYNCDKSTQLNIEQQEKLTSDEFISLIKQCGQKRIKEIAQKNNDHENSVFIDKIIDNVKKLFLNLNISHSINDIIRVSTEIYLISKTIEKEAMLVNAKEAKKHL